MNEGCNKEKTFEHSKYLAKNYYHHVSPRGIGGNGDQSDSKSMYQQV